MDQVDKDLWQAPDTVQLIELINDLKASNDSEIFNNNELYIEVANKLFEYGHSRTYIQCKRKWKELVDAYNEYKKNLDDDPPEFYELLDKVLSNTYDDPSNDPVNQFGPVWTQYETNFLIKVMKVGNFLNKLKTVDPLTVYEQIAEYLHKIGPIIRNREDIQQRWQNLKQSYIKYIKGDLMHFKYFELMDALLDWEPNSIAFEEDQFKDGHEYGDESYQNPDDFEAKSIASAKRALNWTHKETEGLLEVLHKYKIKQIKRENVAAVFDAASLQLRLQGFKRSAEQCRVKFKHLKVKYFETVRKQLSGNKNPERYFYHYACMKDIMHPDGSFPSELDADSSDFGQDEHYEVEYLEEIQDEGEAFEKVFLKDQPDSSYSPSSTYASSRRQSGRKGRQIWSQTETQHLLNLLKAKQVKKYSRRAFFEDIAHEMAKSGYNRTAHTCMIKWKNLRNQLYTSVRNMTEGTEDQCPFYDEIRFIVVNNGQTDSLMFDSEQPEYDESDPFDPDDSIDQKFNDVLEPLELETAKVFEQAAIEEELVDKKRRLVADEKPIIETKRMKTCATNTEPPPADDPSLYVCHYKMDETEHYCISMAPTIRQLSKEKQAKLKIKIQQLLYSAEFDSDF